MEELVLYFSLKYSGDFKSIYHALTHKEVVDNKLQCQLKKQLTSSYTTIYSHDYPEQLKLLEQPPFVLYYYGDLSLVNDKSIAVVGMRQADEYGQYATEDFVDQLLASHYVIVSGMARGVDTIAHQRALFRDGKTIAVLGTGIDYCYPADNHILYEEMKAQHLVISEYPMKTTPSRKHFPYRNRIIAGLANSVLIVQSKKKSGTMITARYALEQGKEIYCIPSRYNDYGGCNDLIKQGAKMVVNINDIIEDEYFY